MSPAGIDPMEQELSNVMGMDLKYQEDCVDGALAQHNVRPSLSLMISLLLIVANISAQLVNAQSEASENSFVTKIQTHYF